MTPSHSIDTYVTTRSKDSFVWDATRPSNSTQGRHPGPFQERTPNSVTREDENFPAEGASSA